MKQAIERAKAKVAKLEALLEQCPELSDAFCEFFGLDSTVGKTQAVFFGTEVHEKVVALLGGKNWEQSQGGKINTMHLNKTVSGVDIQLYNALTIGKPDPVSVDIHFTKQGIAAAAGAGAS